MKRTGIKHGTKPLKRSPLARHKSFGAKPVYDIKGQRLHDSQGEARHWRFLETLQSGGAISELTHQPTVILIAEPPRVTWRADASFIEDGRLVFVDYKPRPFTPRENLLIKLWQHFGTATLRIIDEKKRHTFTTRKIITPNTLKRQTKGDTHDEDRTAAAEHASMDD
jgi:hypothetical protein